MSTEANRDQEKLSSSIKSTSPIWIPPIIIVILFAAYIIFDIAIICYRPDIANIVYQKATIDIGLVIIGIAISVWIGLNIYNIVKKDEIEVLHKKYERIEEKSISISQEQSAIQKKQKEISGNMMDSYLQLRDVFKSLLLQTYNNQMSRALYEEFSNVLSSNSTSCEYDGFLAKMVEIERLCFLTIESYEKRHISESKSYAIALRSSLDILDLGIKDSANPPKLLDLYRKSRRSESLFYSGHEEDSEIIDRYLFENIDEYGVSNRNKSRIQVFLVNSIGMAYNRRYEKIKNTPGKADERHRLLNAQLETYKMYSSIGNYVDFMKTIYYRNWGGCYENKKIYPEAKKMYAEAISIWNIDMCDYKIFSNYCSSILKELDNKCKGKGNRSDRWWNVSGEIRTSLQEIPTYLSIGLSLDYTFPDLHIQQLKYLTYDFLLENGNPTEYAYKAKTIEETLNVLTNQKGKHHVLRDFYIALYEKTNNTSYLDEAKRQDDKLGENDSDDHRYFSNDYYVKNKYV